ncbi:hypothetical protein BXZ70DRAFT_313540 [Cristinia sonorae]|uniref:Uncharacterized protein n=1 Tax=Cristinia sonorae TaxID=1940300 RepID=A0A8K0ULM8_9AGAR|nr:hypothetical protein BXZ70DRAFT_313540 [Cristinia sonorae]
MTVVRHDSPSAYALAFPVIAGFGSGALFSATEYPVLAPLAVAEHSGALIVQVFVQSLGGLLGISVGAGLLQHGLDGRLSSAQLGSTASHALFYEIIPTIRSLPDPSKIAVEVAFGESLDAVWRAMSGVAIVGLLSCVLMRHVSIPSGLDERVLQEDAVTETKRVQTHIV